ncbi:MAG: pyruvate kinase [Spirochaetales bacterium]|nr:pyruvate kinase [Spirochaetales bacterium]
MNKVKIICTIGPASSSEDSLIKMVEAGMNVARLNFSHGTHEDHFEVIKRINRVREKTGKNIGILQDLCGPKIRVKDLPDGNITLEDTSMIRLLPEGEYRFTDGTHLIPVSYAGITKDISEGSRVLLDDGLLELFVEKCGENALLCRVVRGGILKSHKGVNFPGQIISQPIPTEKDIIDLKFGVENKVDFIALSFVQTGDNVIALKNELEKLGGTAPVVSKLERDAALKNLDAILDLSDGIMIARGDLGIETDLSMVPIYQKVIIRKCKLKGIPVITATQMLESMIANPIPTRAEATDVASAIYDGTDAIMLSAETAIGKYPFEATRIMRKIANNVEDHLWLDRGWVRDSSEDENLEPEQAIALSIFEASKKLDLKFIVANTLSGRTAKRIAMYRPKTPLVAITPIQETYYQLSLVWGIDAIYYPELGNEMKGIIKRTEKILLDQKRVKNNDIIAISMGIPKSRPGGTNMFKLHVVGEEPITYP